MTTNAKTFNVMHQLTPSNRALLENKYGGKIPQEAAVQAVNRQKAAAAEASAENVK